MNTYTVLLSVRVSARSEVEAENSANELVDAVNLLCSADELDDMTLVEVVKDYDDE